MGSSEEGGDFQRVPLVVSGFTNGTPLVQERWYRNPAEFVAVFTHYPHQANGHVSPETVRAKEQKAGFAHPQRWGSQRRALRGRNRWSLQGLRGGELQPVPAVGRTHGMGAQ